MGAMDVMPSEGERMQQAAGFLPPPAAPLLQPYPSGYPVYGTMPEPQAVGHPVQYAPALYTPVPPAYQRSYSGHPSGGYHQFRRYRQGRWTHGLCDCCVDLATCQDCSLHCTSCFCPCVTFGRNAEMIDQGATPCPLAAALWCGLMHIGCLFGWVYSTGYRYKMRRIVGLPDAPCSDCCVHLCCPACAFCQEFKELRARALDPTLGWPAGVTVNATIVLPPQPLYMHP